MPFIITTRDGLMHSAKGSTYTVTTPANKVANDTSALPNVKSGKKKSTSNVNKKNDKKSKAAQTVNDLINNAVAVSKKKK